MPSTVFLPITKPSDPNSLGEKHPFGNSVTDFWTALGVNVRAADLDSLPLLAVMDGEVRIHRDPPTSSTVVVTLMPPAAAQADLAKLVGENVILFVYRDVDAQSVALAFRAGFEAWRQRLLAGGQEPPTLVDIETGFLLGQVYANAKAGMVLGKVAPSADPTTTPSFGFEMDYVPNGLLGNEGFARAVELIDPANTRTRRFDPATFLKKVEAGAHPELVLDASHVGHPLLSLLSTHVLIELRNEYNEPFSGVVDVTVNGFRTSINIPALDRGMLRFANGATFAVELPNRVFTELPSGRSPAAAPSRALALPSLWALQFVFMSDVDDADNWFVKTPSALPRYTEGNLVTPLLDGLPTFREIVPAIKRANAPGHFLRMGNWFMAHKLSLIPGDPKSSIKELTLEAAKNGVQTTALLWQGTAGGHATNGKSSWFINHSLDDPNGTRVGFSIMDAEYPWRGSHHQKFLVVSGAGNAVAFCGGIDYRVNRLDDERHVALEGYHDTHAMVAGPAVRDLHTTFIERWNHHPDVTRNGSQYPVLLDMSAPPAAGNQYVQVTHTYAPRYNYPFRQSGELGTLNALRRAIQRAKHFIYFEDQYVTPYASDQLDGSDDTLHILTDLLAALDRIRFLLIVLPNHAEAPYNRRYRYQFIRALKHRGGAKVRIFYLVRPDFVPQSTATEEEEEPNETEYAMLTQDANDPDIQPLGGSGGKKYRQEIFVHSKIWVVDDVYAKIGTANVNRRSTTYDTEVDLHVIDGALDRGVRSAALGLRVLAWAEHLRLTGADIARLDDPIYALNFWDTLHGGRIKPYDEEAEGGKGPLANRMRATFNNVVDPDGR